MIENSNLIYPDRDEAQAHSAARVAYSWIETAQAALEATDAESAHYCAQRAQAAWQRARDAVKAAREHTYNNAILLGATEEFAHALAIHYSAAANDFAQDALNFYRITRKILELTNKAAKDFSARWN